MAESEDNRDEAEQPDGHAVPTEDAREIAGSAEDAALEAYEEAEEATVDVPPAEPQAAAAAPEVPQAPPAEVHEAHAVPGPDAREIAGSAEDAALEAYEEAQDAATTEDEEWEEAPTPREKPAVPGAHLEVDIVPEGVDPLGRGETQEYVDPYAIVEAEGEVVEEAEQPEEADEEVLTEPISTAAIDLASGARYRATGKRKTAIARVTLRPGSGTYLINGRTLEQHFPRLTLQRNIRQPLETVGYHERMDVVARLHGGGISAQAGALRHGVSRALLEADPNLRGELKRRGFLTRDSRAKERKKAGLKKARKRPQFSKR
ncbi:MAG TPA: 30S ribosomal protein S9 [Solirubrobacteraceae bacterium]|nr:30S ribosomal protein S9 [Solirubrobacteraceae bacterium]